MPLLKRGADFRGTASEVIAVDCLGEGSGEAICDAYTAITVFKSRARSVHE